MGEIWLEEFLESLTDEELENLIGEIQEILRKRRGGERYIHRVIGMRSFFLIGTWVHIPHGYAPQK